MRKFLVAVPLLFCSVDASAQTKPVVADLGLWLVILITALAVVALGILPSNYLGYAGASAYIGP